MKTIIWGLSYDINNHSISEITGFLLFFAIVLLLIGRLVDSTNCKGGYLTLIRSKGYARLWRNQWIKMEIGSFLIISFSFLIFGIMDKVFSLHIMNSECGISFLLWFLTLSVMGMIFMLFQNFRYGQVGVFLAIVLIEVFCIYISENIIELAGILIGNYMMLERSSYINPNGYPFNIIIIIICAVLTCFGVGGYRVAFMRGET